MGNTPRIGMLLGKPPRPGTVLAQVVHELTAAGAQVLLVLPHQEPVEVDRPQLVGGARARESAARRREGVVRARAWRRGARRLPGRPARHRHSQGRRALRRPALPEQRRQRPQALRDPRPRLGAAQALPAGRRSPARGSGVRPGRGAAGDRAAGRAHGRRGAVRCRRSPNALRPRVVDGNDFPGYRGVPGAARVLAAHLLERTSLG